MNFSQKVTAVSRAQVRPWGGGARRPATVELTGQGCARSKTGCERWALRDKERQRGNGAGRHFSNGIARRSQWEGGVRGKP